MGLNYEQIYHYRENKTFYCYLISIVYAEVQCHGMHTGEILAGQRKCRRQNEKKLVNTELISAKRTFFYCHIYI